MATDRFLIISREISADQARARLSRQCYGRFNLSRILRAAATDSLSGMERAFVPNWLVRVHMRVRRRRDRVASETRARVVVDGLSGACRRVPDHALVHETVPPQPLDARVGGEMAAKDAQLVAAQTMRWQILRSGNVHLRSLDIQATRPEHVYLPVWLGYFTNAQGSIRVRCVDGCEGVTQNARYAIRVLRGLQDLPSPGTRQEETQAPHTM